ncbi:MAG: amidohydrolase [Clostridia bacterium]|nr:amidohydrolase [Clostridia bacterium]
MKNCLQKALAVQNETVGHRRYLHENAEVGFDVPKTTDYIYKQLTGYGYVPKKMPKGGVIAEISPKEGDRDGFILLRADIDGLKMQEESGLPFACKSGHMHACGHDMHAAALLATAKLLKQEHLHCPVRLLFQPAEEILQGGKYAISKGVTKGVKSAFSLHVLSGVEMPVGQVMLSGAGVIAPSADMFTIRIQGKSCHGAIPHDGVDGMAAASAVLLALQNLSAKEIPLGKGLLTVGSFHAGDNPNVIAGEATLQGSCRAFDEKTRAFVKGRIRQIVKGIAASYRAKGTVVFFGGCPSLLQDERLLLDMRKNLEKELGKEKVILADGDKRAGGSEDFAYISREVPSLLVSVSAAQKGGGQPLHHPKVLFDEDCLPTCVATYLAFALQG